MNKDQSELTLEQLMEIAKNPLPEDEYKNLPPVKRFIIADGLQQGTEKIPAALIYDRYLTWAKYNKLRPVSNSTFFKEFKLNFTKVRTQTGFAYLLSPKGFDLSPERLISINSQRKGNSNGNKKTTKNS